MRVLMESSIRGEGLTAARQAALRGTEIALIRSQSTI